MKIAYFDESDRYHTIDNLAEALCKRGHDVKREKYFSKGVASNSNVIWVEFVTENAIKASNHDLGDRPVVIRGSAMEFYKGRISAVDWGRVSLLVVQGEHLRDYFLERGNYLSRDKIVVLPSAIDTEKFYLRKSSGRSDRIAVVSQVHWRKGVQLIPEILTYLPEQYKICHIGGVVNYDCKNYLESEIRRRKLTQRYSYEGTTGNVPKWLEDKSHFLLCSYTEGLPRAAGEAMSMGLKPMIHRYRGVDQQWPKEYIWENYEELESILNGSYKPEEYRNYILENRSLEVVAEKVEKILCDLLKK